MRNALIVILVALVLLFAPALLQFDGLIYPPHGEFSDLTITHWPAFDYLRSNLSETGMIPLWRTSILGGTPFASDPVVALWYLPNWLSIVLPLEWFFKLIVIMHLSLAGVATFLLSRALGMSVQGAMLSSVAYTIAPNVVAHVGAGHITFVEAWAWIPLVLWGSKRGSVWWAGLALGMCALADLRVAVYAGLILIGYVTVQVIGRRFTLIYADMWRQGRNQVFFLALVLLVGAGISIANWLPAQALASESTRAMLTLEEVGEFSVTPGNLLGVLFAGRGDPERVTYLGIATLMLALIGLRALLRERRDVAWWLIGLIVVGVIIALGVNTPLYALLYRLPGVSLLRVPARAWILVTFAASLACGFGFDAALQWAARTIDQKIKLVSLAIGLFALLFGLGGALLIGSGIGADSLIGFGLFVPLTIGLLFARASGRLSTIRFGYAMLVLLIIDLIWTGWAYYRVVSRDVVFEDGREVAEYLSATEVASYDVSRVYSPSYSVPQHVAQAHGLQSIDAINPLQLERAVRFVQQASGLGEWGYSVTVPAFEGLGPDDELRTLLSNVKPNAALLGAFHVRHVVAHFPIEDADLIEVQRIGDVHVYENLRALPHVWVIGRVDVVSNEDEALDWIVSNDVSHAAVVEGGEALTLNREVVATQIDVYQPDRVEIIAQGPGLLVLSDAYESNWRASIDGVAAQIYPVDVALRGVYLTEGEHRVEFVYDPVLLKISVAISAVMLVMTLIGLWRTRR